MNYDHVQTFNVDTSRETQANTKLGQLVQAWWMV